MDSDLARDPGITDEWLAAQLLVTQHHLISWGYDALRVHVQLDGKTAWIHIATPPQVSSGAWGSAVIHRGDDWAALVVTARDMLKQAQGV